MANQTASILALVAVATVLPAEAGIHVGNIYLRTVDDGAPAITMHPDHVPKLALRDCNNGTPVIFTADYDTNGRPYFAIDDGAPTVVCQVGVYLGGELDLKVGGAFVARVEPAPLGLTISATDLDDLVGGTVRAGTTAMATNVRAIAAVPRTATAAEAEQIEEALSVITFQAP